MRGKPQSVSNRKKKELRKLVDPAISNILKQVANTPKMPSTFQGHKLSMGEYTDQFGRQWQAQIHVVCAKKKQLKEDGVVPMFNTWAIGLRVRGWAVYLLDWIKG